MSQKLRIMLGVVFMAACCVAADAAPTGASNDQVRPIASATKANSDVVTAAKQYKSSVQALIPHYENTLKDATVALEKRKDLLAKGLVSKLDVDAGEKALKDAQTALEEARKQITESDELIAEASAEAAKPAPKLGGTGRYTTRSAVMRYDGVGAWAITEATNVEHFFTSKFGRQLPISAYGQSSTHNRLRFDHRNSVDVAVHPDSAEGKALIDYLRSSGIPFLAFRSAIPGVATGAHIHIGYPSHRIVS